eukprot:107637_1
MQSPTLQIRNTHISFPYINAQINKSAEDRLLVNITIFKNNKPLHTFAKSLKYIFCKYFSQYSKYLEKYAPTANTLLQKEINDYYNTVLLTKITYKYNVGQFGYINNTNDTLEQSFVMITETIKSERALFYMHDFLPKYKYQKYNITSRKPEILTGSKSSNEGFITELSFTPIIGTFILPPSASKGKRDLFELLNWKVSREDYLTKKMRLSYKY